MLKTKEEIEYWLDKYCIRNYLINDDLTVTVNGNVNLMDRVLKKVEVQFHIVNGDFLCKNSNIETLIGFPQKVYGSFDCSANKLTSLEGCPEEIMGDFDCSINELKDFKVFPKEIGGDIYCSFNEKLGELQQIKNFKDMKSIMLSYKLDKELKIRNNVKVNKIKI